MDDTGTLPRLRKLLPWLLEAAFVTDVMLVGLAVLLVATTGKQPFQTVAGTVTAVLLAAILIAHQAWLRRHRDDEHVATARQVARERRGF